MKISIGGDHAGFALKEKVKQVLADKNIEVSDHGTYSEDSTDYPDYAHPVANDIENGTSDLGIVICGSGNGINMTVNKHQGIRSALCWEPEIAHMARLHNNANVLALPARYISEEVALKCLEEFLNTEFEGGRHQRRVDKIACA
jgi:ribose 5-phosphate isomerase B